MYKLRYDMVMRQLEMYFFYKRLTILEKWVKDIDLLNYDSWLDGIAGKKNERITNFFTLKV